MSSTHALLDETHETVVVLDFETSGMSPDRGDRAIEIGAVRLHAGKIVDRFESLINPGFPVNGFIQDLTGIGNDVLQAAPDGAEVMASFYDFLGESSLVAHNAPFDCKFLDAEFQQIGLTRQRPFACSLKVARRVYPEAPNHRLGTLVHALGLQHQGVFHRALADAEMTAQLWLRMERLLADRCGVDRIGFERMKTLGETPKRKVEAYLKQVFAV